MASPLPRSVGLSKKQPVETLLRTLPGRPSHSHERQAMKSEPEDDAPPVSDSDDEPSRSTRGIPLTGTTFIAKPTSNPIAPKTAAAKTGKGKTERKLNIRPRGAGRGRARFTAAYNDMDELELLEPEPVVLAERQNVKDEDDDSSSSRNTLPQGSKRKASEEGEDGIGSQHATSRGRVNSGYGKGRKRTKPKEASGRPVKREKTQVKSSPPSSPQRAGLIQFDCADDEELPSSPHKALKSVLPEEQFPDSSPKKKLITKPDLFESQAEDSPQKPLRAFSTQEADTSKFDRGSPIRFSQLPSHVRLDDSSPVKAGLRQFSPIALLSPSPSRPVCPLCDEEVDQSLLDEFHKEHPGATWRQEQAFCTHHKRAKAKAAWKERKYPVIDWTALDARITGQSGFLRKIINGNKSHFRDIFAEKVKTAPRDWTRRRADEYIAPGYYGGRGLRAMSDKIVDIHSSTLRERSKEDTLVAAARGVGAYVQAVLVPELTVRLIMEDMAVGKVEARHIMEESVWLGELLNEEMEDVVTREDEEEPEKRDEDSVPPSDEDRDSEAEVIDLSDYEV